MSESFKKIACIADSSPKAQKAYNELSARYSFVRLGRKRTRFDVIVVLGGDGFMLQVLHKYMNWDVPFYGMNCGSVGFLMNDYSPHNLLEKLEKARKSILHPLSMFTRTVSGREKQVLAINEVSLFRETRQAAKMKASIDHVVRIQEMICDGVLVSTPAGSTAYNFSAGGPIIPLGANIIALTPLGPFRPRRWRGALLKHDTSIYFEILEPDKRPVSAVADFTEIRDVVSVSVSEERKISIPLLFDPEHNLEERIIKEQFIY
jgi:NAD+ kinase